MFSKILYIFMFLLVWVTFFYIVFNWSNLKPHQQGILVALSFLYGATAYIRGNK